jgi:hypothetical protein
MRVHDDREQILSSAKFGSKARRPSVVPERRGFRSTFVEPMARLSVGGEVELDYVPSGPGWGLTCQAATRLTSETVG